MEKFLKTDNSSNLTAIIVAFKIPKDFNEKENKKSKFTRPEETKIDNFNICSKLKKIFKG